MTSIDGLTDIMPYVAGGSTAAVTAFVALTGRAGGSSRHAWRYPAVLCLLFTAWTGWAIAVEGPFAFWVEHSRNLWGNQIWFDLCLGMGTAFLLLVPRARAQHMPVAPWLAAVLGLGSIGLMAMYARLLYLERAFYKRSA